MGGSRVAVVSADVPARQLTSAPTLAVNVLREHRLVLVISAAYIVIGGALLTYFDRPWPLRLTTLPFISIWCAGAAGWLIAAFLASPKRLRACLQPERVLGAVIVGLLAVPVQTTFQSLKQAIGVVIGFPWDARLDRWDRILHGGPAWHWFSGLIDNQAALRIIDALYLLWFAQILIVLVWAAWTPHRIVRQRALVAMLILWIVAGTIGATLLASAGPCYLPMADYPQLLQHLDSYTPPLFARLNEQGIWKLHADGVWGPLAGISAMPSMHVAFSALAACIAWTRSRWLGAAAVGYALAIQIGSVALGWHYAIDGYAGALCALVIWRGTRGLVRTHADV